MSSNDVGATGAHQAGMYIPREAVSFFPPLDESQLNPSTLIEFQDELGGFWRLRFLHYNSRLRGDGTRNEYRLTCMSRYFAARRVQAGDVLELSRRSESYSIRMSRGQTEQDETQRMSFRFHGSWLVITEKESKT